MEVRIRNGRIAFVRFDGVVVCSYGWGLNVTTLGDAYLYALRRGWVDCYLSLRQILAQQYGIIFGFAAMSELREWEAGK